MWHSPPGTDGPKTSYPIPHKRPYSASLILLRLSRGGNVRHCTSCMCSCHTALISGSHRGKQYGQQGLPGLAHTHWLDDELAIAQGYQRYLYQVELVDTLIGRLVSRLQAEGLYDRSLIVFTADHGVSFRPNQPNRLLTEENAPDILRVPLFIKNALPTSRSHE